MKLFSSFKKNIDSLKAKHLQSEIDNIKQKEGVETGDLLCSKLIHFSKLNIKVPLDFRNCYMENAKLNNIKIARICFWNSKLKNASFTNANLYQVDFWKADLSNTNFSNADLTGCVFSQTNLQNSKLNGAILKNVRLENANLTNVDFQDANLKWARVELHQLKVVKSLQNAIMPDGTKYSQSWETTIKEATPPES